MKLSDMSFDQMMNVVSTIAVEIDPLLDDEEISNLIADFRQDSEENNIQYGKRMGQKLFKILAIMTARYRPALFSILGAFFQCPANEIGKKSTKEILSQIKDSLDDEVLHGFFPRLNIFAPKSSSDT